MRKVLLILVVSLVLVPAMLFSGGANETGKVPEKVTLTMLDLNPEGALFIQKLNESYMEQAPDVIIEYEAMNSRQYDQRIQALAVAENLPDICTTQMFPQYKQMAANDLFMDLTETDLVKSDLFDDIASTCLVKDGKVYGVTWNHLAVGAFYNVDLFKKAGVSIPTNWDEFLDVCEKLQQKGITPIVSDLGDDWTVMYILHNAVGNLIYANNPDYDKELVSGTRKLTDPEWVDILTKIKYIYDKGYYGDNPMGGKYEQSLSDFANGKGAMHIIGTWVIPVFRELNPDLNLSMFPVPFNEPGEDTYITLEGELGMSIAANSRHKEEALKYFEYFFSEEPYKEYLMGKKGFSAVKGINVAFDPSVEYIVENFLAEGKTTPYFTRSWPAGPDALFYKVFQEIMMGTKSISDGLLEVEKDFRASL